MIKDKKAYKILIIEDNPGDFLLISDYLEEQISKPTIFHTVNFKETKQILETAETLFDVVLLDLSLPDKSGELLVEEILLLCTNIPVIILTGYTDVDFSINSISKGIADYLLKDELNAESLYKSIIYCIERLKKNNELTESEKRYSDLFHLSPLPMWVYDIDTLEFLDVNDAAQKHYGYTEEEFLSMTLQNIRPKEDMPYFEAQLDLAKKHAFEYMSGVFRHIKKNGEIINVDVQSNYISYKGRNARVILVNDITERLEYISAIETKNKELQHIAWLQSHVIRAPVAKIMGIVDLIKKLQLSTEEKESLLADLVTCAEELDNVIHDIAQKTHDARLK
ncbi:PAS domain S-box protein [Sediminibacterium sp.]|uniref:PAS domain S-box protein n=1 Tax=Sediminibacterium sp. TaxID=1917865 RepID=UPI003F6FD9F5